MNYDTNMCHSSKIIMCVIVKYKLHAENWRPNTLALFTVERNSSVLAPNSA